MIPQKSGECHNFASFRKLLNFFLKATTVYLYSVLRAYFVREKL